MTVQFRAHRKIAARRKRIERRQVETTGMPRAVQVGDGRRLDQRRMLRHCRRHNQRVWSPELCNVVRNREEPFADHAAIESFGEHDTRFFWQKATRNRHCRTFVDNADFVCKAGLIDDACGQFGQVWIHLAGVNMFRTMPRKQQCDEASTGSDFDDALAAKIEGRDCLFDGAITAFVVDHRKVPRREIPPSFRAGLRVGFRCVHGRPDTLNNRHKNFAPGLSKTTPSTRLQRAESDTTRV
ncbi:MAG: hypothetical protein HC855_09165 [Rhizobiales bacterium]|nr:hypothetical protein [Hyphomicrobiales bacterium]